MPFVTDLGFCPVLDELFRSRRAVGATGRVFDPIVVSAFDNLVVLRNLCMARQPADTLEVGMASGASALAITSSHRDLGRSPAQQHVAVDPFQTTPEGYDQAGLRGLQRAGLDGYVQLCPARSCAALPQLVAEGRSVDLAYIDGSHLFEDVFIDFYYVNHLLSHGGILCFDDCNFPDVRKVVRFIQRNFDAGYEPFDLSPYRPDGGKGVKYGVKRRIGRTKLRAFRKVGEARRPFRAPFTDF